MNKKTEKTLLRITREVASMCKMENALVKKPDPQQEANKQQAKEILLRTTLPNDWTTEQNNTIAFQMQQVIDEPPRMIDDVDPRKLKAYNQLLTNRIRNAIKSGELPDPMKDKDFARIMKLHQK